MSSKQSQTSKSSGCYVTYSGNTYVSTAGQVTGSWITTVPAQYVPAAGSLQATGGTYTFSWPPPAGKDWAAFICQIVEALKAHVAEIERQFEKDCENLTPTEYVNRQHCAFSEGVMWAVLNLPEIVAKLQEQEKASA